MKENDCIVLGENSEQWIVKKVEYESALTSHELNKGDCYDLVNPRDQRVSRYRLINKEQSFGMLFFSADNGADPDIVAPIKRLPALFKEGAGRLTPSGYTLKRLTDEKTLFLPYDKASTMNVQLHIPRTHVLLASGKPQGSPHHFTMTTDEPYGVCCVEGIKVSFGMHRFGNSRFGSGLLDDFRSIGDRNTRIIGGKFLGEH